MKKFDSVDDYFDSLENWKSESERLREIVEKCGLEETLKWSMPVYVKGTKNVVGIFSTKAYFGLWFYQGALLSDAEQVLINAQTGKTKALRQWRMTDKKEIKARVIKKYLAEAIHFVEQGTEIKADRKQPVVVPELLQKALNQNRKAKNEFEKMSKTYRREYTQYIAEAKREETKLRRIKKILPMIADSVGLNDKYRS